MKTWSVLAGLALVGVSMANEPATQDVRLPNWGIMVGVYIPTDAEMRDLFGDSLLRFGISPISNKYGRNWSVHPEVGLLTARRDGNRILVVPVTMNLTKSFATPNGSKTYVSVGAGPAYYDYRLRRGTTVFDDEQIGWNANAEVGVLLGNRLSLQARYDLFEEQDGFDMSGWSISLNYALFRW